mgnify:CR=1 FL=1
MLFKKLQNLFSPAGNKSLTGKVKFFNRRRGYGFIEAEDIDRDIFVHVTDLEDFVSRGDQVAFNITKSAKGYEAKNVKLVNS